MTQGCRRLNPCWEMTVASAWLLALKIYCWGWLRTGFGGRHICIYIYKVNYCICAKKNIVFYSLLLIFSFSSILERL